MQAAHLADYIRDELLHLTRLCHIRLKQHMACAWQLALGFFGGVAAVEKMDRYSRPFGSEGKRAGTTNPARCAGNQDNLILK
jgi:hypothetical protein